MKQANIKMSSATIKDLQAYTGETTGHKAVETAVLYFLKEARQRQITSILDKVHFKKNFNPLKLRNNER